MKEANEGVPSENKQPVEPAPSFERINKGSSSSENKWSPEGSKTSPKEYNPDAVEYIPFNEAEAEAGAGLLYARMKKRTGRVIPDLEQYLPERLTESANAESGQKTEPKHRRRFSHKFYGPKSK